MFVVKRSLWLYFSLLTVSIICILIVVADHKALSAEADFVASGFSISC